MGFPILLELLNSFLVGWNICFHDNSKRYRKFISEFTLKLTKEYFYKVFLRWTNRFSRFYVSAGADPGFQVRGAHLNKLRRAEGSAKNCGVFRVKIHDFTPIKQITESPSYP